MKTWGRSLIGAAMIALMPFELTGPAPAAPRQAAPAAPPAPAPEAAAPQEPSGPPPYDEQLLRLAEILGSMHYLRTLCGGGEGSLWRDQMQGLLTSEQPDPDRRARWVDRFNRGYEGFRAVYRTCTLAATEAIDRYMDEGAKLARDVIARYGKER